jgi:hypothetical protein
MPEYRTPGVYIEEISAGPRPVAASPTTETGFVGILTLPTSFVPGRGKAEGMFLPAAEDAAKLTWNRALAFRGLLPAPADDGKAKAGKDAKAKTDAKPDEGGNRLQSLVKELLPGDWDVEAPSGTGAVSMKSKAGEMLRFAARRTLLSVKTNDKGAKEWDLAWGADEQQVMEMIAHKALEQGVKHAGNLGAVDPAGKPVTIDPDAIHNAMVNGNGDVHHGPHF